MNAVTCVLSLLTLATTLEAQVLTGPVWTGESDDAGATFSDGLSDAGDVNGDGFGDVIVGSPTFGLSTKGRVEVFHGSVGGLSLTADWTEDASALDGRFGHSVSGAGDVNGDGFGDVIVGAYTAANGQVREGRAYVYYGSSTGLAATAAWTVESNQAEAQLGQSVSGAGDVNGDGFDDVIVGAFEFDNGSGGGGRVFVYHGSLGGLSAAADWTADWDPLSLFPSAFGFSVSDAGDVDGDGYDDVIIGDPSAYGDEAGEGRAYVFMGSATGLAATPAWQVEGNQNSAQLGYSVSGAGDVNADGFGDVIVGARELDDGPFNEGTALVYLGSAGGLATAPIWIGEGDQVEAHYGVSVSGLGDINCDGFGDVIVGAYL
jgi:hypothetical protein